MSFAGIKDQKLCMTRGIKNAKYLRSIAPQIFAKLGRKGFTSLIPARDLLKLHTTTNLAITNDPDLAKLLEENKPPSPKATIHWPLFNGTLFFVNLFLGTPSGTISMNHSDIQTAINYAKKAVISISHYASQYGSNTTNPNIFKTIRVSDRIINFAITIDGNKFSGEDLEDWVSSIGEVEDLPGTSSCIVFLIDDSGSRPFNSDGDRKEHIVGYHSITNNFFGDNYPYIFVNVNGKDLTVDDKNDQYADTLSHEIAEMIVDPIAGTGNPEVCDGCAGNCDNGWNDFFDQNHEFIDASVVTPSFKYSYFIASIIKPNFINTCEKNRRDICVYSLHDASVPSSLRGWLALKGLNATTGIRSIMSPRNVSTIRELIGYP